MLLLLIIDVEPTYGYDVIRQLRERSGDEFDLPEGTIYPALHRLHRDGHLEVTETRVNGRRRRIYAVTDKGRRQMAVEVQMWQQVRGAIDAVVVSVAKERRHLSVVP